MGTGLIRRAGLQILVISVVAIGSHWWTKATYERERSTFEQEKTGRVTGLGGVFFKSEDPGKLKAWYTENLGFKTNQYGTLFEVGIPEGNKHKAYMQWSAFSTRSDYFEGPIMMNYRVDNLEVLLKNLRANNVEVVDSVEVYDYGKFVHIRDLEGNKIELWEPIDSVFSQYTEGAVTK